MSGKIFGIGLSRTGTTSLSAALSQLGYRSAHFAELRRELADRPGWFAGDFATDYLVGYDAAADLPVATFFPQLDERYPESRFILTVRAVESWLDSVRRHWQTRPFRDDAKGRFRNMVRLAMYGIHGFSESRMRTVYEFHLRTVHWFFRNRPADLLVIDICAGEGWEKLCPFLGKSQPKCSFPWANKG
jgi:hypothetical protein